MKRIFLHFLVTGLLFSLFSSSATAQVINTLNAFRDVKPVIDILADKIEVLDATVLQPVENSNQDGTIYLEGSSEANGNAEESNVPTTKIESKELQSNELLDELVTNDTNEKEEGHSVEDLGLKSITIYPNPALYDINIEFGKYGNYEINLYNLVGQLEFRQVVEDVVYHKLDISNLNEGIYLLQLVDGEKVTTHRIKVAR